MPGATGFLDTNYAGKVAAALEALKDKDLVFVHVEAPDEAGHSGELKLKLQAIEDFDAKIVGPLLAGLKDLGDHRVLVLCDHFTPISLKTHSSEPVPFILYDSRTPGDQPPALHRGRGRGYRPAPGTGGGSAAAAAGKIRFLGRGPGAELCPLPPPQIPLLPNPHKSYF